MPGRCHSTEEIIGKLREAEALLSQGEPAGQVARSQGISEQAYCRWRMKDGGLRTDQAQRLKTPEQENGPPKKPVADLSLDIAVFRETVSRNRVAR